MFNMYGEEMALSAAAPVKEKGSLPAPFSIQELHQDVLNLYFYQARSLALMAGPEKAWQFLGMDQGDNPDRIFDAEVTAQEIGLTYEAIKDTIFASSIDRMYSFGYDGLVDPDNPITLLWSDYTWISAILHDLANSNTLSEWESHAGSILPAAERCFEIAKLANARVVLEGGENFYWFGSSKDNENTDVEGLTILQMALLSGMEEMSVRAAANPKRAKPLETYNFEGKTRVKIEAAKAWLIEKGRYVPVSYQQNPGEINLETTSFKSFSVLKDALEARLAYLVNNNIDDGDLKYRELMDAQILELNHGLTEIPHATLRNHKKLQVLAEVIGLDPRLLQLRVRETSALEELKIVTKELRHQQ